MSLYIFSRNLKNTSNILAQFKKNPYTFLAALSQIASIHF
jgi:hypothetical protein